MKAVTPSVKRLLGGALACIGLAALVLQPLAAHAATLRPVITPGGPARHGTTMHESYRVFPGGAKVPGTGTTTSVLLRGSTGRLTAPDAISGTIPGTSYRFLFWDIGGHLYTHRKATFVTPGRKAAFAADAWYVLAGGGCCGPTAVTTYGFSLLKHRTLPGTPIASVVPAAAWTPPSASVATTTAVTITAANPVEFVRWLAPGATVTGTQLTAGAGVSTLAIAFYGPNPCQAIQNQIDGLSAADFPPPDPVKEYQIAVRALLTQLRACEARHGG